MVIHRTETYKDGEIISTETTYVELSVLREERQHNLVLTDFYLVSDVFESLTSQQQTELKDIRKKWRDMPSDAGEDLEKCEFPKIPEWLKSRHPELVEY